MHERDRRPGAQTNNSESPGPEGFGTAVIYTDSTEIRKNSLPTAVKAILLHP